ncbi:MAG TPA: hypothetical protein DCQ29_02020 [Chitinophagaceae bacterium]|nr:hypothetical protein [Chitinophagaceae bacterium]
MKETVRQKIPVKQILLDPTQPRKVYNDRDMLELKTSMASVGMLQPIMVCPTKQKNKYLLVFGERRLKCAQALGWKEIDATLVEMTEEQIKEAQLVENLQRRDVHPMEEATAFFKLSEKYDSKEIALRVGKSEAFVVQRIKLNQLVEELQELFLANAFKLKDAIALATLDPKEQKEFIKEKVDEDWRSEKDYEIDGIWWYVDRKHQELDEAPFDLTDANLYPEAGACTKCPFNTANTPLLFEEPKHQCTKGSCFQIKLERNYKQKIELLTKDPEIIPVITAYSLDDDDKQKLHHLNSLGLGALKRDDFETIEAPEPLQSFEAWKEDEWYDEDDEEDAKAEYEKYKSEHENEVSEFQAAIQEEGVKKAVVVIGSNVTSEGKEIYIKPKGEAKLTIEDVSEKSILSQIVDIETNEKQNEKKDAEKVWAEIIKLTKQDGNKPLLINSKPITSIESRLLVIAMFEKLEYSLRVYLIEDFEMSDVLDKYHDIPVDTQFTEAQALKIQRAFLLQTLVKPVGSHQSNESNKGAYQFIQQYLPTAVSTIESQQFEKTDKRKKGVAARIESLKAKIKKGK